MEVSVHVVPVSEPLYVVEPPVSATVVPLPLRAGTDVKVGPAFWTDESA